MKYQIDSDYSVDLQDDLMFYRNKDDILLASFKYEDLCPFVNYLDKPFFKENLIVLSILFLFWGGVLGMWSVALFLNLYEGLTLFFLSSIPFFLGLFVRQFLNSFASYIIICEYAENNLIAIPIKKMNSVVRKMLENLLNRLIDQSKFYEYIDSKNNMYSPAWLYVMDELKHQKIISDIEFEYYVKLHSRKVREVVRGSDT